MGEEIAVNGRARREGQSGERERRAEARKSGHHLIPLGQYKAFKKGEAENLRHHRHTSQGETAASGVRCCWRWWHGDVAVEQRLSRAVVRDGSFADCGTSTKYNRDEEKR